MPADPRDQQLVEAVLTRPRRGKAEPSLEREEHRSELYGQHEGRGRHEGEQRGPGRQSRQPALEARDRWPATERRHCNAEVMKQHLLDKDDRCRQRHEGQFEGAFEMVFHRTVI